MSDTYFLISSGKSPLQNPTFLFSLNAQRNMKFQLAFTRESTVGTLPHVAEGLRALGVPAFPWAGTDACGCSLRPHRGSPGLKGSRGRTPTSPAGPSGHTVAWSALKIVRKASPHSEPSGTELRQPRQRGRDRDRAGPRRERAGPAAGGRCRRRSRPRAPGRGRARRGRAGTRAATTATHPTAVTSVTHPTSATHPTAATSVTHPTATTSVTSATHPTAATPHAAAPAQPRCCRFAPSRSVSPGIGSRPPRQPGEPGGASLTPRRGSVLLPAQACRPVLGRRMHHTEKAPKRPPSPMARTLISIWETPGRRVRVCQHCSCSQSWGRLPPGTLTTHPYFIQLWLVFLHFSFEDLKSLQLYPTGQNNETPK